MKTSREFRESLKGKVTPALLDDIDELLNLLSNVYDSFGVWAVADPGAGDADGIMTFEQMRALLDEQLPDEGREPCPSIRLRKVLGR